MLNLVVLEEIKKRITAVLKGSENQIMTGQGLNDFADYRYSIGYVKGVVDANAIIDSVIDEFTKESSSEGSK